ncbi:hypothetical protein H2198_002590 [Neophaeococcomyces mojaviensis]|uniref:Uncharacterized protein n=1 Tax=Neophaeococcomyces mojaviensis TaxID=3383035 RepID=A0ACC3ADT1_9EURO|nr:hypothetical protein H2198_002590 [Knufia sp. JES_112]
MSADICASSRLNAPSVRPLSPEDYEPYNFPNVNPNTTSEHIPPILDGESPEVETDQQVSVSVRENSTIHPGDTIHRDDSTRIELPTRNATSSLGLQNSGAVGVDNELMSHSLDGNESNEQVYDGSLLIEDGDDTNDFSWTTEFLDLRTSPLLWTYLDDICLTGQNENPTQISHGFENNTPQPPTATSKVPHATTNHFPVSSTSECTTEKDFAHMNINPSAFCSELSFPTPLAADQDLLLCEDFCHIRQICPTAYEGSKHFFTQLHQSRASLFPTIQTFHAFAELYFEYFDKDFPFVHPRQIEKDDASWILLIAIASVGAQYSAVSNAEGYVNSLQFLLEQSIKENVSRCVMTLPEIFS